MGRWGAFEAETIASIKIRREVTASIKVRREVRRPVGEPSVAKTWGEWDVGRMTIRSGSAGYRGQTEKEPH